MKNTTLLALGLAGAAAVAAPVALRTKLKVRGYTIPTAKRTKPLRIALLTDLHNCRYGAGQHQLLDAVQALRPDVVLLGGDFADDWLGHSNTFVLLRALGKRYACYYVFGNHEVRTCRMDYYRRAFGAMGITVLEGDCQRCTVKGEPVQVCGVVDPEAGGKEHLQQAERVAAAQQPGVLSLLLAHRPEYGPWYASLGFDIVMAGHAHGGQWRIPGLVNGFLAPNQGLFPAYAGGVYPLHGRHLVVSRGLERGKYVVPRIFNPPELVVIDVAPTG